MADAPQVLVVGAGPVGLVTALGLARDGVCVRVVDARADVDDRMRASMLHPPTLDLLASLELAEPLVDMGLKAGSWQLRQFDTGKFVNFDIARISDRTAYPFRLQVEQARLCRLALDRLRALGVSVEFDTPVEWIRPDEHGADVTLGNGGEPIRAAWVVGADGASSMVRQSLDIEFAGRDHEFCSVLVATTFPFHEYSDELEPINYCWSYHGPFSLLQMKDHWRVCLYPNAENFESASEEKRVRDLLGYIHEDAAGTEIIGIVPYRARERCASQFRVGRICLAGDAAHLNPTTGGMGMNGGIHDAMNLSAKLAAVLEGESDDLMDLYSRQRRYAANEMVIPRASANKARMAAGDPDAQMRRLARYRAIAADDERCREYLLATSMITGLDEANAIE